MSRSTVILSTLALLAMLVLAVGRGQTRVHSLPADKDDLSPDGDRAPDGTPLEGYAG